MSARPRVNPPGWISRTEVRSAPLPTQLAMRAPTWTRILLLALLTAACVAPVPEFDHAPRRVDELARWDVWSHGERVGEMLLLEIQDPRGEVSFYHVRNRNGQWLGFVDRQGRVYQRVPFSTTELFRGVHPMPQALALLCQVEGPVAVLPLEGSALGSAPAPALVEPLALPAAVALTGGTGVPTEAQLWSGAGH